MQRNQACHTCGNYHTGDCSFQVTYFQWKSQLNEAIPHNVQIVGSWYQWQNRESMTRQIDSDGCVYFQIGISIPVGRYQYKYLVDGTWRYNKYAPTVQDPYGSFNNYVEVLPKKAFLQYIPKQDTKITSNITLKGLKIVGSWDNWQNQISMELAHNSLKGCDENFVYLQLVPNTAYEFKFKVRHQYLIDQKYPTVPNQFGGYNNRILVCNQVLSTPTGWRTSKISTHTFSCRAFQWSRIKINPQLLMYKKTVEGHSMSHIGDFLYIFGGRLWGDFTNRLSKVNIHRMHTFQAQQILPVQRAYHCAQSYGNKMIIYGGHNQKILQDYNVLDTSKNMWTPSPQILGKFPPKRQKSSCVLYEMLLVLFGGYYCSPDFEFEKNYNDIQVLDIEEMRWIDSEHLEVDDPKPQPRYSHTATLIYSEMYVFGGTFSSFNEPENLNYNDLWMLNLQKVKKLKWEKIQAKGKPPTARHGHTCNALQNYLVIFGGQGDKSKLFNDVIIFNRQTRQWIHPLIRNRMNDDQPIQRAFHAATTVNNEHIVIFGGKSKNPKPSSFYILRPQQLSPELQIQQQSDEDIQTESNRKQKQIFDSNKEEQQKFKNKNIDQVINRII